MYQTLSESASFCKRYDKTFWCLFRFTVLAAVHWQNTNAKFHKVEFHKFHNTIQVGWKRLYFSMTNLLRTICTKFYHNRSGFADYIKKYCGVFFSVHSVVFQLVRNDFANKVFYSTFLKFIYFFHKNPFLTFFVLVTNVPYITSLV